MKIKSANKIIMPVLFIGHGSPENAFGNNSFARKWKLVAKKIPTPKAILCISAHWLQEGSGVTAMDMPRTIHDFYGFPKELYAMRYPANGSEKYAKLIRDTIKRVKVNLDYEWGLDHGTWIVLKNMYPAGEIPVLQLSLDYKLGLDTIFALGKELQSLRTKGVLIIGSGNLVHNLMVINPRAKPYSWAVDFDSFVAEKLVKKDYKTLLEYHTHPSATLAHPSNDHYLPLLYVIGAAGDNRPVFFNEKIIWGSISMRCVAYGLDLKK